MCDFINKISNCLRDISNLLLNDSTICKINFNNTKQLRINVEETEIKLCVRGKSWEEREFTKLDYGDYLKKSYQLKCSLKQSRMLFSLQNNFIFIQNHYMKTTDLLPTSSV